MNRWLELANQFDGENLKYIPAKLAHDNGISMVYINKQWVYKRSIPFMIENEIYFLRMLNITGFVPGATRYDKYTIRLEFVENEKVVYPSVFEEKCHEFLGILRDMSIDHGDLTIANVLVRKNMPVVLDWGESRLRSDPRPLKRQEGDTYWMQKTMQKILSSSTT